MSWWKPWKRGNVPSELSPPIASEAVSGSAPTVAGTILSGTDRGRAFARHERRGVQEAAVCRDASTSLGPQRRPVVDRPKVFDPALKHFANGLVPGDPEFESATQAADWERVRRRAMLHVLRTIAQLPAREHLVLRGSALMCAWFGQDARAPKDLDFVVVPQTLAIDDSRAVAMLNEIVAAVIASPCEGIVFDANEVDRNYIWTYDRVPGTRIVFRWTAEGMPWGSTQLDFVFFEPLPQEPNVLEVALDERATARVLAATKPLSLAWKLLWLHSDMHPRAKDIYDAMLLAEACELPAGLLEEVFKFAEEEPPPGGLADVDLGSLEWVGFEEAQVTAATDWYARLKRALDRTKSGQGVGGA